MNDHSTFTDMKNVLKNLTTTALATFLLSAQTVFAQVDDIYYDPARDVVYETYVAEDYAAGNDMGYRESLPSYSEDYNDYTYWDDYGYQYTSRIRRFHNPYGGFGYYDPVYSDMGFYDPWMMPGTSIYIGVGGYYDYWQWRRMNRWRMNNSWMYWGSFNTFGMRMWMDPWSYNNWGMYRVYDPWFDPYWGGSCFGPSWGWGGFNNYYMVNNFYGHPGYWYGNSNGTIDNHPTYANTYNGPRTADARTAPSRGTVRDPEYSGGGIPRFRDVIGSTDRPQSPDIPLGEGANGRTGRVDTPSPSVTPGRESNFPARKEVQPDVLPPTRRDDITPVPEGRVTPPTPVTADPTNDRRRWSDFETPRNDRPADVKADRSREDARTDYIRGREAERKNEPRVRPQDNRKNQRDERYDFPQRSTMENQYRSGRDDRSGTIRNESPRQERPSSGWNQRSEPRQQDRPSGMTPRSESRGGFESSGGRNSGGQISSPGSRDSGRSSSGGSSRSSGGGFSGGSRRGG